MEPLEMPSTQSSAQYRAILVDTQGSPLKINLQAVELEGRPKLVRTLKNSGALVVSNAKEAAIILVDSATESGKRLIRTWGHDATKVVLERTWARASIDAGRPLLEADTWGGALTIDDGKPVTIDGVVVDEDELEEVEALVTKSPLPTPRVTPVDAAPQRPENSLNILQSDSSVSPPHITELPVPRPPVAQPAVAVATIPEEPMADTRNDIPASPSLPPPPATQQLPRLQPASFALPSQPHSTYMHTPFSTQQAYSSPQPQMMSTQPFPHPGFSSSQSQIIHASGTPHTPLPSVRPQTMSITSNAAPINGVDLQTQNLATLMTIMEVVRQSNWLGQNPMLVSQPPGTPGPPFSTSTFQATRESEPRGDEPLSNSQDHLLSDTATSLRKSGSGKELSKNGPAKPKSRMGHPSSPDQALTPSISRKRPSAVKPTNPPRKRLRKSKEKALPTDSSEHFEDDGLTGTSDCSYSTRSSASLPGRPRNIIARKKRGEIFLSGSAQPLRFFVQVDLHGRHAVVTNIKKNKGKIVNNIADADYVILFSRSDTFQGLLNETIALEKSPILAAFVADCVEEGALLDETDYVLESFARVKALKRGRQSTSFVKIETPETFSLTSSPPTSEGKKLKTHSKPSAGKKTRAKKTSKSAPSKFTKEAGDNSRSRSPTPPPVAARQVMGSGRYLFTKVEDEYFLHLAKYHLTRDPTISNTALISKLHKKMPHHSVGSWSVHIDKKLKGALEDVRKRANIANRKRVNEVADAQKFNGSIISQRLTLGTAERDSDTPSIPGHSSQEDLEWQDFEVITQFFASGRGDDDDDELVWQELEKHQPCRSASSWPDYYAARQERVYARIEELMNERAGE